MIHYQLRCSAGHEFDGWFRDSTAFELQAEQGMLACPHCAVTEITRAMMAPRIGAPKTSRAAADPVVAVPDAAPKREPQPEQKTALAMPDELRAALARMRSEIEQHCDYVGTNFAAEARRIHQGAASPRGIYGEASPDEAEALAEDGIDVARIPWVPRADS